MAELVPARMKGTRSTVQKEEEASSSLPPAPASSSAPSPPAPPQQKVAPSQQSSQPKKEPASILRHRSREERRPPRQQLSWVDERGGGLVEVHYREELHYSLHSRDKEVVRRQQLRNGCPVDDCVDVPGGGLNGRPRSCCLVS